MTDTQLLIIMTIIALIMAIIASMVAIFVFLKNRSYLQRLVIYHDGLVNIQARLKDMFLEHHTLMVEEIHISKKEIIDQIGYTLRWGEVLAKLIQVGDQSPEYAMPDNNGNNKLKKAEQMHEIGVNIVEVAFDEKVSIEKQIAEEKEAESEAVQDELNAVKEELKAATPGTHDAEKDK